MVKIEAVIRSFAFDEVRRVLESLGAVLVTSRVMAHGADDTKARYRGAEYAVDSPRVKVEVLASAESADEMIGAILRAARTTLPGDDGTIVVYEVADAIRIRSGVHLQYTLA